MIPVKILTFNSNLFLSQNRQLKYSIVISYKSGGLIEKWKKVLIKFKRGSISFGWKMYFLRECSKIFHILLAILLVYVVAWAAHIYTLGNIL